jgi:crotonobetainyl-CoA hydratase
VSAPSFVRLRREGHVLVVTLNRPEVLNALHGPAHRECEAIFDSFAADPQLRVAVVTGEGPRAFCAGADLKARAAGGDAELPASGFGGLTNRFDLAKPLIAAVEGLALGGGFEIALACDIIIASAQARFGLPEPRVGVAALAGGLLRLPRAIGLKRAMPLMLTGGQVTGQEGERLGFVSQLATPGRALDAALVLAQAIAACGPAAIRAAKTVAMQGADLPLEAAMAAQAQWPAVQEMRASPDYHEGGRAFAQKRAPRWAED